MIPLYNTGYPTPHLGFPMMQNRLAPVLWSYLIETHAPRTIIEIGTHDGGLSIILAIAAQRTGARFITYDINDHGGDNLPWFFKLGIDFRRADVFTRQEEIAALINQPGPTFVLCDGGNKPKEFATFAPFLKKGDLIAAHDYCLDATAWCCVEVQAEQMAPTMASQGLARVLEDFATQCAWFVAQKL